MLYPVTIVYRALWQLVIINRHKEKRLGEFTSKFTVNTYEVSITTKYSRFVMFKLWFWTWDSTSSNSNAIYLCGQPVRIVLVISGRISRSQIYCSCLLFDCCFRLPDMIRPLLIITKTRPPYKLLEAFPPSSNHIRVVGFFPHSPYSLPSSYAP